MKADNALAATSDLVRRDHSIPGLGLVLDPARLLADMKGQLKINRVDDISLDYLRYKPGMNCLARYRLDVNGQTINAYAKAHGEGADNKISKSLERPVINGLLGPGRVVLNQHQIIFSVFPNDSKLLSLRFLGDAAFSERLFYRLFGPDSNWQNTTPGPALNYKPERRYVFRLTRADHKSALVKFYSDKGYAKARSISRRLAGSRPGFYPETIGRSKKHNAIAYHWQPGTTLRQLNSSGNLSLSDMSATAESLAEFHASGCRGLSSAGQDDQTKQLYALAEQVGILLPKLQQRAQKVAKRLAHWRDNQPPVRQAVHGDFYDQQAIVHAGKVRLIDLDAAHLDDPLLDLGSYIADRERQALSQAGAITEVDAQKETLISTYERLTGSISAVQLDKYIALGLFGLIHKPFRDWSSDWPAETAQLLERVENLIAA